MKTESSKQYQDTVVVLTSESANKTIALSLRARGSQRLRSIALGAFALGVALLCAGEPSYSRELNEQQLYELAYRATGQIWNNSQAELKLPTISLNIPALQQAFPATLREVEGDNPGMTKDQATCQAIHLLLEREPERYTVPEAGIRTAVYRSANTGTGFVVHPDGFIVTNAHVVNRTDRDIVPWLKEQVSSDEIRHSEKLLLKTLPDLSLLPEKPPDKNYWSWEKLRDSIKEAMAWGYLDHGPPREVRRDVTITMNENPSPLGPAKPKEYRCVVQWFGVLPCSCKDIAILKRDGSNLPYLQMSDDKTLPPGASIVVIGYPRPDLLPHDNQATITGGLVSAIRSDAKGGGYVIQTDASIHGGNSGGPALDRRGGVVGVATFGYLDPETRVDVPGLNFLVPSSFVKVYLDKAGIRWESVDEGVTSP
jgi:serine protease Do